MKSATLPGVSEVDRVFAMRMHRLLEAGYTAPQAEELAGRIDIDLHEAEVLIQRIVGREGKARSSLAFRILI